MRTLKLIGIGAGNPDYITVQAINALKQVDVVFLTDKGAETADLMAVRREICERYITPRPYRVVEIQDPKRDRSPVDYSRAVAAWHRQRADLYERLVRENLSEKQCGAFLIWGDPGLYDSALRIVDEIARRKSVEFEYDVIPGISSIQALAARHRIPLNRVGQPLHITTGRKLAENTPGTDVAVLLDGGCAFKAIASEGLDIYWGAYLGTPDEILLRGPLSEVGEEIERVRTHARHQKGWIMDAYLLRKREGPPC
jgi:precorrin-6A synthase